uniref:Uncharacterized protein n=1 Tax=Ignisphaera aggregans TaxID=334771 RepID=A0A7C5UVA3_9CREN
MDNGKRIPREVYKLIYINRGRYRTTSRSIENSIRLGYLAKELAEYYLEVVEWGRKRVLKLKR